MKFRPLPLFAILLACSLASTSLMAQQQHCQPPALSAEARERNIFTPRQEMDLGDAIAEHLQRNFRVIEDEDVTAYLRRVGERLVKNLPQTEMRFQFFLYDQPEANAFALPGGRIYVSRKLVAFTRNEDELASVLSHELGHIVSRQTAVDMTRMFREVLGVEQVTDRNDIFQKYNLLVENAARKPSVMQRDEDQREQLDADQIGVYTMAGAGYDPHAFAAFWDRFAQTKGKTGGWFSDLFGTTKPESRRLREIIKVVNSLPAECAGSRLSLNAEEYQSWQASVINYSGLGRREVLHGVVSKKSLNPPLRGDISHIRFSPDGRFVLAQDDSGINVLLREPLALIFRIEAPEAYPAQFTPDSRSIVFYTQGLRVESWSIDDEEMKSAREMVIRKKCLQTALAPDGHTLACLDTGFDLSLFDVASGEQVFQKKSFYAPTSIEEILLIILKTVVQGEETELISMGFSPDAHYFAAGHRDSVLAVDLTMRSAVPLRGQLKRFIGGNFAFISADRVAGTDADDARKSAVLSFPGGEVLSELSLGRTHIMPAAHGDYLMIRPIPNFPVGVVDMNAKKIILGNKQSAFDIYDQVFMSERRNGELGLYNLQSQSLISKITLPRNSLGRLRAAAISPDFKWLAVSERTRGAVWDLTRGERVMYTRGFRGAYFSENSLYADFPEFEQTPRLIAKLDLSTRQASEGVKLGKEEHAEQYGPFLVVTKPLKKSDDLNQNVSMEVRDVRTGSALWSREFPREAPQVWLDADEGAMVLAWPLSAGAAKAEIKNDPALSARLSSVREESTYFIQVLDARNGKVKGGLLAEVGSGSFRLTDVVLAGDWVVIADSQNRVLVYSLSSGEQKGKSFGSNPAVSKAGGLLSVESERGQVTVYDLATMKRRDQFTFSSPIALTRFNADGRRLFVLTAAQTAYTLDISQ